MTTNPNGAAWDAMQDAMARKVEPSQASALVAEAVLRAAWDNARGMLDAPDVQHTDCIDGACNVCILETFAMALGRRHWSAELTANRAVTGAAS
jgi:hypothetical protein